ncbi:hypothetical protein ACFYO1_05605 [Nocardia sp. NPDC006044]|uniref:hypothetical protein n=1 Tax=Nocardia sp. NPDC006044 TaxID=3364306 RepID=UPI00368EA273
MSKCESVERRGAPATQRLSISDARGPEVADGAGIALGTAEAGRHIAWPRRHRATAVVA